MSRGGGCVCLVGILLGLVPTGEAAITLEVGEEEAPLTQQQLQTLSAAVEGVGDVEKLEVDEGRLEATLDAATVTPAELQGLLAQAVDAGVPFEVEVVGNDFTPAEIQALQDALAGTPVEFEVEVEDGLQEIKIETPDEVEVAELEEPDVEDEDVEEPEEEEVEAEGPEDVEEPDVDEPEVEEPEVDEPEDVDD